MNEKILFVDDDVNAIAAYVRSFKSRYKVEVSSSGKAGLALIENSKEPFAVVVSDYKMPEMNGSKFLAEVKKISPDTVRVMLTGYADADTAINAVNEGNIFRLLTKPCSTDDFAKTLADSIEMYKLITAEKELLNKTLKGSINLLTDILSIVNPIAFSHTARLKALIRKVAEKLGTVKLWEVEVATLLSHIGCITVPTEILEKKFHGIPLDMEETKIFENHPKTGETLLKNIPRLEEIAEVIGNQLKPSVIKSRNNVDTISKILKIVNDFDLLVVSGVQTQEALRVLSGSPQQYDSEIVTTLKMVLSEPEEKYIVKTVNTSELETGMILAEHSYDVNGSLLLSRGREISEVLRLHLLDYERRRKINGVFKVLVRSVI